MKGYAKPKAKQRLSARLKSDRVGEETDKHRDGWQPWRSAAHRHYSAQYQVRGVVSAQQDMEA